MSTTRRSRRAVALLAATSLAVLAACSDSGSDADDSATADSVTADSATADSATADSATADSATADSSTADSATADSATVDDSGAASEASQCGAGTGEPATDTPIVLGAIVTEIPGLSFSDETTMAQAYFDCVNENGGIHGHPIEYYVEQDGLDAQLTASAASNLINNRGVMGFVGTMSVLDCPVNSETYATEGLVAISAGADLICFNLPNIAPVNNGPSFSALATAQHLVSQGADKLVIFTSNTPGSEAINQSIVELAEKEGIESEVWLENVPLTDANALALRAATAAGSGGGIVVNVNPGEALKVFKAAEQQGLIDAALWGCPAGCNDATFVQELGGAWDGKLGVNAEFNLTDSTGPDNLLYLKLREERAPDTAIGNFGQMGVLAARIAVEALLATPEDTEFTRETVGAAFRALTRFESDLYCQPWYFGDQDFHTANNVTRTVTPQDGKFVLVQDCEPIPALPNNNFEAIRAYETEIGIS